MFREVLKKWFLFGIDKEEKELYRERVMKNDHKMYQGLLLCIMFLQALMFAFSFVESNLNPKFALAYRCLYAFLFIVSLLAYALTESLYKKNKKMPYFVVVSLTMFAFMLWGSGISILDSKIHNDLTYFCLTVIAASLFITLEPWVTALCCVVSDAIFSVCFALLCNFGVIQTQQGGGFFLTTLTACAIAIVGSTFNFIKRINVIGLEIEVSKLNITLQNKAYIDDLTKTYNRRYLTENIDAPLNYGEPSSAVIMFDIDHFKRINDMYGHQIGDLVLAELGKQLLKLIEGKNAYVVRYGGEEFLVYYSCLSRNELFEFAEDFRKQIESISLTIKGGNKLSFTVSGGLALAKTVNISYNDLINQADKALYEAKKERNKISF